MHSRAMYRKAMHRYAVTTHITHKFVLCMAYRIMFNGTADDMAACSTACLSACMTACMILG